MKVFISPRNNANNSRPKIWEKTRDQIRSVCSGRGTSKKIQKLSNNCTISSSEANLAYNFAKKQIGFRTGKGK